MYAICLNLYPRSLWCYCYLRERGVKFFLKINTQSVQFKNFRELYAETIKSYVRGEHTAALSQNKEIAAVRTEALETGKKAAAYAAEKVVAGQKREANAQKRKAKVADVKLMTSTSLFPELFTIFCPESIADSIELFSWSWFDEATNRRFEYLMNTSTMSEKEKGKEWKYWVKQLQCARNLHQSKRFVCNLSQFVPITEWYIWYYTVSESWMADGMTYPREGIIGRGIALEDKMDYLIDFLQKKEGREPVVWVAEIHDDIYSSIAFYCIGSNDFLVALKKLLETDQIFRIKKT